MLNRTFSSSVKRKAGLPLKPLDPRMDFRFFMMRTKVIQVYREALQEARQFRDPDMREQMTQMVKDEFRPLRRDRSEEKWKLDIEKIDYQLACIRKTINMIKELKERAS